MNQEPKSTIETLLDECSAIGTIAAPSYTPYLVRESSGEYSAHCNYSSPSRPTAVEALLSLKERLLEAVSDKQSNIQTRINRMQQELVDLRAVSEQVAAITNGNAL